MTTTLGTATRDDYAELAARLTGPLLLPGDDGYDEEISPFNLATVHTPAVVVGAAHAADVAAAVAFAARHGLAVGVQATGHGAVTGIDGMLVSTRRMQEVRVDPDAGTATVGAGVAWADVVLAAATYGLTPLVGSQSGVGAVGYTVGGGLPVLGRTFGFAADHVRSFDVVTADGVQRHVDAGSCPDLFWGLRGGKDGLGIVTAMTIGLVPVDRFYGGCVYFPGEALPEVLRAYRDWTAELSDRTSTSLAVLRLPPAPQLPELLRARFLVQLRLAHVGDAEEGERLAAPMRALAPRVMDTLGERPVTAIDGVHQDPCHPMPTYERCTMMRELSPQVVDLLLHLVGPDAETAVLMVKLRQMGGALARPPAVPNAVTGWDADWSLFALGVLAPETEAAVPRDVDALVAAFAPHGTGTTFPNLHGVPGDAADRARAWSPDTARRLRELTITWDPDGMFRYGHVAR
jgi:hypothetical protein